MRLMVLGSPGSIADHPRASGRAQQLDRAEAAADDIAAGPSPESREDSVRAGAVVSDGEGVPGDAGPAGDDATIAAEAAAGVAASDAPRAGVAGAGSALILEYDRTPIAIVQVADLVDGQPASVPRLS